MVWYSLGRDREPSADDIWIGWCNHSNGLPSCTTPHLDYWGPHVDQFLPTLYGRPWVCVGGVWLLLVLLLGWDRIAGGRAGFLRRWIACAGGITAGLGVWWLAPCFLAGPCGWQPFVGNGDMRAELHTLPYLLQPSIAGAACVFGVGVAAGLWVRGGRKPAVVDEVTGATASSGPACPGPRSGPRA